MIHLISAKAEMENKNYKKIKIRFLLLLLILQSYACSAQSQIQVEVKGFKNDKGNCKVCLFNDRRSFLENSKAVACKTIVIQNKHAVAVFKDQTEGYYAILVFHDENNNGKLDKNFLGIPKEGYGASNNQLPFAAAPSYESSKFYVSVPKQVNLIIIIRNIF